MTHLVLRDVVAFTPEGRIEGDCLIQDGRVAEIGRVTGAAPREIDAGGQWLWPGAIDAHVHLRDPGLTHKEDFITGSKAAVSGGVTCAFDMPNTHPSTITADALEAKKAHIASRTLMNFGLFFGANPENLEEAKKARNVAGLKIFMASSTGDLLVDKEEDLDRIFAGYERRICVHAESEARLIARDATFAHRPGIETHSVVRDPTAARLGVEMATKLANRYGRQLHVLHVSTRAEVEALDEARALAGDHDTGARISAEACPHHLFLTTDAYGEWGCYVQMNPPLRREADRAFTWEALRRGSLMMIATDHAPHLPEEKERPYRQAPSGVPGIQTVLPMMLDAAHRGLCTHEQVLEWLCHAPARIYGIQERGRLVPGFHADLVLIDPELSRTHTDAEQRSRCGWTPWRGRTTTGWPMRTFVGGHEVFVRDGDGSGQLLTDAPVGQEVDFDE